MSDHAAVQCIGWAVKHLWDGLRVRREGWNGKGMFLALVAGSDRLVGVNTGAPEIFTCRPYIGLLDAQGYFVPWLASQPDLLATDWIIAL